MSNGTERIVPGTMAASFCVENQGETEREKKRNCWQRVRSAFCHCFENITDCFDFWFCKHECCNFCCSCDDYYDEDDENERCNTIRVAPKPGDNWEAWTANGGIANEAVGTENEEYSSTEIHQGGDNGVNNSDKHSEGLVETNSGNQQSSRGQHNDYEVCVVGGGGDADNQVEGLKESHSGDQKSSGGQQNDHGASVIGDSGAGVAEKQIRGLKESHSCDQQSSGGQHNDHGASVIGGSGDAENQMGGHKESHSGNQPSSGGQHNDHGANVIGGSGDSGNHSGGHYTNHGESYSGNDSGGYTSGGDHGVTSDFGGGGDY